jgi:tight adherence protein B
MVTVLLLATAALLWPPGRPGMAGGLGRHPARRASRLWRDRLPGSRTGLLAIGATCVALGAITAGPAGTLAAGIVTATLIVLGRSALADRHRRSDLIDIIAGLRLLSRELRSGAAPAQAAGEAATAARGVAVMVLAALATRRGSGAIAGADPRGSPTALAGSGVPAPMRDSTGSARSGLGSAKGGRLGRILPAEGPVAEVVARLTSGWILAGRHGLAITPMIDAAVRDASERLAADTERASQVAGPRMSGYVMAGLPLMGLLLGVGMGADPVHVLTSTALGNVMLIGGVALTCAGLLWSARIVRP